MPEFDCLRCGTAMRFVGQEKLQLGQTSWLLGDWPNLVAGSLKVSIMACPHCGKLEFFSGGDVAPTVDIGDSDLPQRTSPVCGTHHDFDYPKCPLCGYTYGPQDEY